MILEIFGKKIKVNVGNSVESQILREELGVYKEVAGAIQPDLTINYLPSSNLNAESRNPSLHLNSLEGFEVKMVDANVVFNFKEGKLNKIDFSLNDRYRGKYLLSHLKRFYNIQYKTTSEAIGQAFHEYVLVPAMFFDPSYSVVHASGIYSEEGTTVLFGGTGGVGKTSLELELCLNNKASFLCDDIAIVNNEGYVFPNLAYPKVYAYNVEGNNSMKAKVLGGKGILDRFQWYFWNKLIGPNRVRRRIHPKKIYGKVTSDRQKLNKFIILFRSHVSKLELKEISPEKAAKLNASVIASEYADFFNHIHWHEYNRRALDQDSFLSFSQMKKRVENNLNKALHSSECFLLHIPMDMPHENFKVEMGGLLKKMLKKTNFMEVS
ncbi:hypothetical protein [Xanthovirga aplysinae]|uniref:hypothetical protein n=1 Tax=Xanthovirga aplysinae TaxID=2529853 RepID=UPI0012BCC160|nr:hypothetical protein [Xanthovirga aplysinae]MTI31135.1 hypothetical protein [Xanthovirga aplysinae]